MKNHGTKWFLHLMYNSHFVPKINQNCMKFLKNQKEITFF